MGYVAWVQQACGSGGRFSPRLLGLTLTLTLTPTLSPTLTPTLSPTLTLTLTLSPTLTLTLTLGVRSSGRLSPRLLGVGHLRCGRGYLPRPRRAVRRHDGPISEFRPG